jgi:hypothetical protein
MPCPKKRNISPWHGVQSAASITKEQSGNITVTTMKCFAANRTRTTYSSNMRCMLIIYSQHKTNILSFMHRTKIWKLFQIKMQAICSSSEHNLKSIKYCFCNLLWTGVQMLPSLMHNDTYFKQCNRCEPCATNDNTKQLISPRVAVGVHPQVPGPMDSSARTLHYPIGLCST